MGPALRTSFGLLVVALGPVACSSSSSGGDDNVRGGVGGSAATSTGGAPGTGGSRSTGGGMANTGGSSGSGTGGDDSSGGTVASSGGTVSSTGGTAGATGGTAGATGGTVVTGGTVATGGAVSPDTGLPSSCGGSACNAAVPADPELTDYGALGNVTVYSTSASDGGACLYGSTSVMYYAAINVNLAPGDGLGQWQGGTICGQCFVVTVLTSEGLKETVVRIMDKCPDADCGIDLGGTAPDDVMVDGAGRYQGAWRAVSCEGHPEVFDGVPSLFVKDGSNPYWSVVQVRSPMMAVAAIDWENSSDFSQSGTLEWSDSIENYLVVPTDLLQANASYVFTVRYVDGTTASTTLTSAQLGTELSEYALD